MEGDIDFNSNSSKAVATSANNPDIKGLSRNWFILLLFLFTVCFVSFLLLLLFVCLGFFSVKTQDPKLLPLETKNCAPQQCLTIGLNHPYYI